MSARPAGASRPKKRSRAPTSQQLAPETNDGPAPNHGESFIDPDVRRAMIAQAAYYRAEQRGFEPGRELEDWYAAENEIDTQLARGETPTLCGGWPQ